MWIFAAALCLLPLFPAFAEDAPLALRLPRSAQGPYSLVERSDWSRYDNGKYTGHLYREVRASIIPEGTAYRGNFFVMEETLRDMRQRARAVDAIIPVSFHISPEAGLLIDEDRGFPAYRNFPAFPDREISPGDRWTARGTRAVDPLNEGRPLLIPLIAEYEYRGVEDYRGVPVHRISAKYASRETGPPLRVTGTHEVDILLRLSDGVPLMTRDTLDETYVFPDGRTLRFRGFTLTFGATLLPLDRETLRVLSRGPQSTEGGRPFGEGALSADSGIAVGEVDGGLRLTIKDIRFQPDSDEMLASEGPRLELLAQILREIPNRTFLVEGHTAAVGQAAGELALSVRRARRMVDELTRRGLGADRFIYKGWGGTKPLGDNATEEGRRLNRRVTITILE